MQGDAACTMVQSFDQGTVKDRPTAGFDGEVEWEEPAERSPQVLC